MDGRAKLKRRSCKGTKRAQGWAVESPIVATGNERPSDQTFASVGCSLNTSLIEA